MCEYRYVHGFYQINFSFTFSLSKGHNPYKLTTEAQRELQLAGYCVAVAKTRAALDNDAKQFLETLSKASAVKQQKKEALVSKVWLVLMFAYACC